MINGFIPQTKPLTEDELKLVPLFVNSLLRRKKDNPCSHSYIIKKFAERNVKLSGARIRKIIHHIRINTLVPNLVANGKGYYVSEDPMEVTRYVQSLYQRAGAIVEVAKSFER